MKQTTLVLGMMLLVASLSPADEGPRPMSLTVNHDISVGEHKSIASRDFSFDLELTADRTAVTVTVVKARATSSAHGMEQLLGTRHITGKSFALAIADDGRLLKPAEPADATLIDLGPPVVRGFSIARFLADSLPVIPEKTVAVGATWISERQVLSLGGWAWGTGRLTSRHRVTAVDRQGDHTVVSVTTEAVAKLSPVEGEDGFAGDLKRTLRWTFDATEGRLLSMSMEQEADGVCPMPQPQGPAQVHHVTRADLAAPS